MQIGKEQINGLKVFIGLDFLDTRGHNCYFIFVGYIFLLECRIIYDL
jgi:hypothetical protein